MTKKIKQSFLNALKGLLFCCKTELNFRIHICAVVVVVVLGYCLHLNQIEWLMVMGSCLIVLVVEMLNTCVERVCDLISTDFHPTIKNIKDVAAGAVLLSASGSCVIGTYIFLPKLINIIQSITC